VSLATFLRACCFDDDTITSMLALSLRVSTRASFASCRVLLLANAGPVESDVATVRECFGQSLVEGRRILLHHVVVSFCMSVISSLQRATRESPSSMGLCSFKWSSGNRAVRLMVGGNSCRRGQSNAIGAVPQSSCALATLPQAVEKKDMVSKRKNDEAVRENECFAIGVQV
jgi:hypothetical protein